MTEILNMGVLVSEVTFKDLHKTISMSNSQRQQPTTLFSSVFKELAQIKSVGKVLSFRLFPFVILDDLVISHVRACFVINISTCPTSESVEEDIENSNYFEPTNNHIYR
jgi:hypothetical protein